MTFASLTKLIFGKYLILKKRDILSLISNVYFSARAFRILNNYIPFIYFFCNFLFYCLYADLKKKKFLDNGWKRERYVYINNTYFYFWSLYLLRSI